MTNLFQQILDWSEVWAPLIPLIIVSFAGKQPRFLFPVTVYLWFALVLDAIIDVGWKFDGVPGWMYPNNYLYNIHAIGRFFCFAGFFYLLAPEFRTPAFKLIPPLVAIALVINFYFFEPFINPNMFSSRLLAAEGGLLLFYCIRYFLSRIKTRAASLQNGKEYWVILGLCIYVVFNFFYFLLYTTLLSSKNNEQFVANMWNIHNLTFIILCTFIARAFYVSGNN